MLWFDLDNSPHVPLFRPILAELDLRKLPYTVTARDFAQTEDLLRLWNIPHQLIGRHAGKNKLAKIVNLFQRASALSSFVRDKSVSLAISHGSRTQLVAAKRLGVRSLLMLDYEYTEARIFNLLSTYLLMPSAIPDERLASAGFNLRKVIRYHGFKEEIYLKNFVPDPVFRDRLGISTEKILVTIRPPSTVGNYHDPVSESLFRACLQHFSSDDRVHCLVVNRTRKEIEILPPDVLAKGNVTLLKGVVDGLQLIWHSDIVISGGGTMNRESSLLGVPTYSIFTGRKPYLDEHLAAQGRLTFVNSAADIGSIPVVKRTIGTSFVPHNSHLSSYITDLILDLKARKS
jgi:predicted glycosyltransferase